MDFRAATLGLLLCGACAAPNHEPAPPAVVLLPVAADLSAYVERQMREQDVPGVAIAVLDVDPVTAAEHRWLAAFGRADAEGAPLRPDAVFRVASLSKLFTATAVMVLVERGLVDLDAPVARYLPEFAPRNPFGVPVTVRHLLAHRGGLVREPPVGHYFDPSEPSLAEMVAGLTDTELVHAPGTAFKYSNPGFGVLGAVVERVVGQPFPIAARHLVLQPLGLVDSDFGKRPDLCARTAEGVMWTYDGRAIPTPDFAFGFGPAADLRSTVGDLLSFARSWLPHPRRAVLSAESLARMWQPAGGESSGYGLGCQSGYRQGCREVGHDGAVYGFASALRALPEQGLAVAVVCTKDFANAVAEAIAARALDAALLARRGERLPPPQFPEPVGAVAARALAGHYRAGEYHVDLLHRDAELVYDPDVGVRTRMRRATDGSLVADSVLAVDSARRLFQQANGMWSDGAVEYVRDDEAPPEPPAALLPLLGEYGFDHDVLVVYEDHGRLGVLIEWVVRDLPEPVGPDLYHFPPGMYGGDRLRFERDAQGEVVAAVVGGARFERRPEPPAHGFRITPLRPIAELAAAARDAVPPVEPAGRLAPDLVDLAAVEPTLVFDLRYATADNFLGAPIYPAAVAKLQRPVAAALARVQQALRREGLGLCVFDAYRPWSVSWVFWHATPPALRQFVADPAEGSRHNRGCAVDVTLVDLATGRPVDMPSGFDEFTPRAYPDYPGGTSRQRHFRERLRMAMAAEGFTVNPHEWWHFDHADWARYGIANLPLP
ncbi:MAG: serine hydrolase [Planctomycetes bacterium]|nr:serine hydrolase [Planctomycetota bacterium]